MRSTSYLQAPPTRRPAWLRPLALLLTVALVLPGLALAQAETLVLFDHFAGETPESIVFDRNDNAYISLAFTGEIRKVAPDNTVTSVGFLPIGTGCAPLPALILGLAIDQQDRLFVAVASCDPSNQGLWEVDVDTGASTQVAQAPSFTVLNGIDVDKGQLYGADTFGGLVWRVDKDGGLLEIWSDDPLLARPPGSMFPGPNGLKVYKGEVYVANSATGNMVAIDILPDGSAGAARIAGTLPFPQGCDEFTFDVHGSIYCTTDPFNTIVRLDPDGTTEILLTAADLLDGPTSVAFGRRGQNRKNLYITNAAFPIFTTTFRPSLMRIRLDVVGAPKN